MKGSFPQKPNILLLRIIAEEAPLQEKNEQNLFLVLNARMNYYPISRVWGSMPSCSWQASALEQSKIKQSQFISSLPRDDIAD